jgi:hypothetical protein
VIAATAQLSDDSVYRYHLGRAWDDTLLQPITFVMLNPSTADAHVDDPTIRRCIGFAKSWGYSSLSVVNLFAFRATDPKALREAGKTRDVIGPETKVTLDWVLHNSRLVVAAWGAAPWAQKRAREVMNYFVSVDFHCIRKTKLGAPEHPLYLPGDLKPTMFRPSPSRLVEGVDYRGLG